MANERKQMARRIKETRKEFNEANTRIRELEKEVRNLLGYCDDRYLGENNLKANDFIAHYKNEANTRIRELEKEVRTLRRVKHWLICWKVGL